MKSTMALLAFIGVSSLCASAAHAGPYADELGKCLVSSTTKDDRAALIRWMFSAASQNPAVRSIAKVSEKQLDDANKTMGQLMMRLLTQTCKAEAQKALQYEGAVTMQLSFQILGQVAGQEMMSSPEVVVGMSGLKKYIDENQLKALTKSQ